MKLGGAPQNFDCLLQDVTKQQAKERAIARKQVAGQGTLDKFFSPSEEKQVQKQLARSAKNAVHSTKNRQDLDLYKQGSKQAVPTEPSQQKRAAGLQQPQDRAKRPRRQMIRLYEEEPAQEVDLTSDTGHAVEAKQNKSGLPGDDDADFQPAKRARGLTKSKSGPAPIKSHAQQENSRKKAPASKADAGKTADAASTVSFQGFSYSKGDSKTSKHKAPCVIDVDTDEVNSVQRASSTRSKTTYVGLY